MFILVVKELVSRRLMEDEKESDMQRPGGERSFKEGIR